MRKKRFDSCKFSLCPHPTWSGKAEKDEAQRHCIYHSPQALAAREGFTKAAQEAAAARKGIVKVPRFRFAVPLVCVYKPHHIIATKDGVWLRTVFTAGMCGKKAPRRTRDKSEPRYPNRFGEPLCADHATHGQDTHAFPGDVGLSVLRDEREEEHKAKVDKIVAGMPMRGTEAS